MANARQRLSKRLRQEREQAGLSLEELGEKADVSGAYISHIEACRRQPTLDTVEKLAHALGMEVNELLTDYPSKEDSGDAPIIRQFTRLIRSLSPYQKRHVMEIVKSTVTLAKKEHPI